MSEAFDRAMMDRAVELARIHMEAGEGKPFGAVLTRGEAVIAEGWNAIIARRDPTEHAEMMAIRLACRALGTGDLSGTTVYASGEPCPMCLAACYLSGVGRVVFGSTVEEALPVSPSASIYADMRKPHGERRLLCELLPAPEAVELFHRFAATDQKGAA